MNRDLEHLRLLAIFHYIFAGLTGLGSLFPIIHLVLGIAMVNGQFNTGGQGPPPELGWFFIGIAGFLIVSGITMCILMILAGRALQQCRRRVFCIVVAAFMCLMMPLGTVLGVFTIIVLMRDSARDLFERTAYSNQRPY